MHELVVVVLGACAALLNPVGNRWRKWRATRAQYAAIERWIAQAFHNRNNFVFGPLVVKDIQVVAMCREGASYEEFLKFRFVKPLEAPRPDPPEWQIASTLLLPSLVDQAAARGLELADGPQVDMVSVIVKRHPLRWVGEPTIYEVHAAPTTYHRFAAMSNSLDLPLEGLVPGESSILTLRQKWAHLTDAAFFEVSKLPAPCVVGTATVVVTSDGLLVAHIRSHRVQISHADSRVQQAPSQRRNSARTPTIFLGEGMIPRDHDDSGFPSPARTVVRSMCDELGVQSAEILEVVPTGVIFDTKRWQPIFCYVAYLGMEFSDLALSAESASDEFESEHLVPFVFDIGDARTRSLLLDEDPSLKIGSNHAHMALLFAMVFRHGQRRVLREIKSIRTSPTVGRFVDGSRSSVLNK